MGLTKNTINYSKLHEDLLSVKEGRIKEGYTFGHEAIDQYFRFKPRNFNIILGHANVGKTSLTIYLMLIQSLKNDLKWLIYSSENEPYSIMKKLIEYYNGEVLERMTMMQFETSLLFLQQYFMIMDISELQTYKSLLKRSQEVYDEWEYDGLLIDPYNSLAKDKTALTGLTSHDYDYMAASEMRMFCSKNNVSIWLNTHAVTEALRRTNKKGSNYEGFPSPPMAADSEGGGKWVNRASDFMVIHRYSQHPDDWMYSHLHIRKVKEMETGGRPTPMEEPIVLRSKPGNTGFEIAGVDLVKKLRGTSKQIEI
jgi:hypothetical protein